LALPQALPNMVIKSPQIQASLQPSQRDISIKQNLIKSLKQRLSKKFSLERMWGGCLCRFRWQVTKATTHTHTHTHTRAPCILTIIENKWSLGEIKIAERDTARYMQAPLSSIAESSVSKWGKTTTSKIPCCICVIHETCKPRVSKNNTLMKGVETSFCA